MKFKNETYDFLKKIALYVLPALATFWITIAKIWGLPYGAEIGGTITAVDTFLGAMLGLSSKTYYAELEEEHEIEEGEYYE